MYLILWFNYQIVNSIHLPNSEIELRSGENLIREHTPIRSIYYCDGIPYVDTLSDLHSLPVCVAVPDLKSQVGIQGFTFSLLANILEAIAVVSNCDLSEQYRSLFYGCSCNLTKGNQKYIEEKVKESDVQIVAVVAPQPSFPRILMEVLKHKMNTIQQLRNTSWVSSFEIIRSDRKWPFKPLLSAKLYQEQVKERELGEQLASKVHKQKFKAYMLEQKNKETQLEEQLTTGSKPQILYKQLMEKNYDIDKDMKIFYEAFYKNVKNINQQEINCFMDYGLAKQYYKFLVIPSSILPSVPAKKGII